MASIRGWSNGSDDLSLIEPRLVGLASPRQAPEGTASGGQPSNTTYRRSTAPIPRTIAFPSKANENGPPKSSRSGESGPELGSGMGLYKCGGKSLESEERRNAADSPSCMCPAGQLDAIER